MKKLALSLIGALSMLLSGVSAYAQDVHIRITVPFDFSVNNKTMPAGQYDVLSAGLKNPGTLVIRNATARMEMYVNTLDRQSPSLSSQTKLVFQQYGGTYFLSQIWTEGSRAGLEFPKARTEIQEAKAAAGQQVVLAAKLGR